MKGSQQARLPQSFAIIISKAETVSAALTQVVLGDEASAGRAPVVAPELDPQSVADGDVGRNGAAAEVSQEGTGRALAVDLDVVAVAIVWPGERTLLTSLFGQV